MQFTRNQLILLGIGLLIVIIAIAVFVFGVGRQVPLPEVNLRVAGTMDQGIAHALIDSYRAIRPNVKISYTELPEEGYEARFLEMLASGQAPDIVTIEESWLPKHRNKLFPALAAQLSLNSLRVLFPQVVEQAFAADGLVYAAPLTIDTLALFYNKDRFDAKTIALPPVTWSEFQAAIPILREMDEQGRIARPAAAVGGSSRSILHAADVLNLLFLQSGEPRIQNDVIRFDDAGNAAFAYYLNFANPASDAYTWNDNLPFSFDAFANGSAAMIFGYAKDIPALREKNAFLNFGITLAPQTNANQPVSAARFAGLAVTAQSRLAGWAWDFIREATTNPALAEPASRSLGMSPALRTLIEKYAGDPSLGVFSRQALTARLYPVPDAREVRRIFSDAITAAASGRLTPREALSEAAERINGLKR